MNVADEHTIISTQGIRFVERIDSVDTWGTQPKPTQHKLRVTYKGCEMCFLYPDAEKRDAQFKALAAAMTRKQGDSGRD